MIGKVHRLIDPSKLRDDPRFLSLLKTYFNIEYIPCLISSPLREDKSPSFSVFYSNSQDVLYKDFSTGESGTMYNLLSEITGKSIYDLLEESEVFEIQKPQRREPTKTTIDVIVREFEDYDLKYWDSYGISLDTLKLGNIYPIRNLLLTRNGSRDCYPIDKYAYVYVEFIDGNQVLKVYQPYSKHKWLSNFTSSVVDLYSILPPTGDNLIITSSRKDALTLVENLKIPAICFNSETSSPEHKIIEELLTRFKNVWVLFDNDYNKKVNVGDIAAKSLIFLFNKIKQLSIPSEYQSKDPSDLVLKHGRETLINVIKNQIFKQR